MTCVVQKRLPPETVPRKNLSLLTSGQHSPGWIPPEKLLSSVLEIVVNTCLHGLADIEREIVVTRQMMMVVSVMLNVPIIKCSIQNSVGQRQGFRPVAGRDTDMRENYIYGKKEFLFHICKIKYQPVLVTIRLALLVHIFNYFPISLTLLFTPLPVMFSR